MTSILTNTAAMSALSNLTATQRQLSKTQAQVSSGLAVATASDNAAYWSIGQTMSAQVAGLTAVQKSLSLTTSIADVTSAALQAISETMKDIKNTIISAKTAGIDRSNLQTAFTSKINQIKAIAESASFNGVNFLAFDNALENYAGNQYNGNVGTSYGGLDGNQYRTIVPYQSANSPNALALPSKYYNFTDTAGISYSNMVSFDYSSLQIFAPTSSTPWWFPSMETDQGILGGKLPLTHTSLENINIVGMSNSQLDNLIQDVDTSTSLVHSAAVQIGSLQTRISNQQSFNSALSDSLTSGIGSLVDADMNVASVRLQALQTQQQLGIQALSIANQNSQLVLKLFQAA